MFSLDIIDKCVEKSEDCTVTVGIIENERPSYIVYGGGGAIMAAREFKYELCGVTQVFICALLQKCLSLRLCLPSSTINEYIDGLPEGYSPTLIELATHTSGLKQAFFKRATNAYLLFNPTKDAYSTINKHELLNLVTKECVGIKGTYCHSDTGLALLGEAISKILKCNIISAAQDYIQNELKLYNTAFSNGTGDLKAIYRKIDNNYSFAAANGLAGNIGNSLRFLQLALNNDETLTACLEFDAKVKTNEGHAVALGWLVCKSGIVWQSGTTASFNCFYGIDKTHNRGVAVLSNCAAMPKKSAAEIGLRFMHELREGKNHIFL